MATNLIEGEIVDEDSTEMHAGTLSILHSAEIDMQIATAKKYPRSIKMFQREATEMVTLSEDIAGECMYALKRSGKTIEGPSARFAEVIASAWGNCRAGARVVEEDGRFVTAQGMFNDVQRNVVIVYEVKRRITGKDGKTFNDDMIGVTSNAACSIALRNSVLKGIPKTFWKGIYDSAKQTAIGNAETLNDKRAKMIGAFGKMGVTPQQILDFLEVPGEQDINLDHMALLRGVYTSIKDGETTVDQAFELSTPAAGSKVGKSALNDKLNDGPASLPADYRDRLATCKSKKSVDEMRAELGKGLSEDDGRLLDDAAENRLQEIADKK